MSSLKSFTFIPKGRLGRRKKAVNSGTVTRSSASAERPQLNVKFGKCLKILYPMGSSPDPPRARTSAAFRMRRTPRNVSGLPTADWNIFRRLENFYNGVREFPYRRHIPRERSIFAWRSLPTRPASEINDWCPSLCLILQFSPSHNTFLQRSFISGPFREIAAFRSLPSDAVARSPTQRNFSPALLWSLPMRYTAWNLSLSNDLMHHSGLLSRVSPQPSLSSTSFRETPFRLSA